MIVKHLNENLTVRITNLFPIFHLVFTYKNKAWTNNKSVLMVLLLLMEL